MTLKQLRYITVVADTGNITDAARKLYIAQPSLTASIQEIAKEAIRAELEKGGKELSEELKAYLGKD